MKKVNLMLLSAMALLAASCSKTGIVDAPEPNVSDNSNISLPSGPGDVVGKVIVGYQGWFSAGGDGSPNNNWSHWSTNNALPVASNTTGIKSWPDVREYTTTYQTGFGNLGNGQPSKLYSPWDQQTVNKQVEWMQQNGIDGLALQRFGSWTTPGSARKNQVDGIATRIKNAAQTYGRKFYIMYDCTATDAVEADWTNTIIGTLNLLSSPSYAKQNGKPVVCFWGVGKSGRGTPADWVTKINWFKSQGCYVIGGTLAGWRTDTPNMSAYNACNMIMPWMVGVISTVASSDNNYTNRTVPDIAYCNTHSMDYQQCIIPGDLQQHQRVHGDLMWRQFYNAKKAGTQGIYIAMYDEYNEGNQIAKTAESAAFVPAGSSFLGLDEDGTAVSSDYYLRLTGDGGKMLKGQIALTTTRPTPYFVSSGGTVANGTYKIINLKSGLALDAKGNLTANGTLIEQWGYGGGNNQKWTVTSIGGGQYKIIGVASGRSLDVTGNTTTDGAAIQLYDYHNGGGQNWVFTATSGGYYTIKSAGTGKVLDVTGNSTAAGTLIQQWSSSGGINQQWAFQAP